ncbi:transposable element Tcb1 transposase [Trichonephila clavipes]|uniref:Transposable element Tcb1 transposase n=1 Tax=Trichonephila clavipes TaxID=2585209 RepID=A0A8X6RLN7_TRICX|nr:transposable element Tcb1 transposase [Trichonephila clavipes]
MRTGIFGSYCQKKQTEHSIRPVSSALFSYRYDSFKADRAQRLGYFGLYARRPVRCVPFTTTHCHLRLTWSRKHALWTPQQWSCVMFSPTSPGVTNLYGTFPLIFLGVFLGIINSRIFRINSESRTGYAK